MGEAVNSKSNTKKKWQEKQKPTSHETNTLTTTHERQSEWGNAKNYTRTWNIYLIRPTSWLPSSDLLHPSAYQIMLWMANIHRYLQSPDSKNVHLAFFCPTSSPFFSVLSLFWLWTLCHRFTSRAFTKRNIAYRGQHRQQQWRWMNKKRMPCASTLMAIGIGWCSGPNYPLIAIDVLNRYVRNFQMRRLYAHDR